MDEDIPIPPYPLKNTIFQRQFWSASFGSYNWSRSKNLSVGQPDGWPLTSMSQLSPLGVGIV